MTKKVVSIIGSGRTGSTLLMLILGSHLECALCAPRNGGPCLRHHNIMITEHHKISELWPLPETTCLAVNT